MKNNRKIILEKYIRVAVRKLLHEQEQIELNAQKALYIIHRFPKLKELFNDLMSSAYGRFIANIEIVAPKPTTFIVELINGQEFNIIYLGKGDFKVKILGKSYYTNELNQLERASQSISNLLTLSKKEPNPELQKQKEYDAGLASDLSGGGGSFSGGGGPGTFPGAEQPGGEQLPGGENEPQPNPTGEPLTANSEIPPNEPEEEKNKFPQQ